MEAVVPAPRAVLELIERFRENLDDYKSGQYNETQLRREFLDPFFEALGWDVHNRQGWAETYKEVIHEDAVKIGGMTKAPDYCFRVGGARKSNCLSPPKVDEFWTCSVARLRTGGKIF
jgi:hypothetical protein